MKETSTDSPKQSTASKQQYDSKHRRIPDYAPPLSEVKPHVFDREPGLPFCEECHRYPDDEIHIQPEAKPEPAEPAAIDPEETKKDQILRLYASGQTDIAAMVRITGCRPSYVAQILQAAGYLSGYFDLYTATAKEANIYSRFFRDVLNFKDPEAARQSVEKIDRLHSYFERLGDRAGQHQAQILALTGKNRARWSGKKEESEIFAEWLNRQ